VRGKVLCLLFVTWWVDVTVALVRDVALAAVQDRRISQTETGLRAAAQRYRVSRVVQIV